MLAVSDYRLGRTDREVSERPVLGIAGIPDHVHIRPSDQARIVVSDCFFSDCCGIALAVYTRPDSYGVWEWPRREQTGCLV